VVFSFLSSFFRTLTSTTFTRFNPPYSQFPTSSLMGFGGIGGLTFGLAAKDLISNFIGGAMLAVVRPFSPGEKVFLLSNNGRFRSTKEPTVGAYQVKEIGWYQTTLVPKDTRPTTVPNGYFLGANVVNISRWGRRGGGGAHSRGGSRGKPVRSAQPSVFTRASPRRASCTVPPYLWIKTHAMLGKTRGHSCLLCASLHKSSLL